MKKTESPIDIEGIYRDYIDLKQDENTEERYKGNENWYHASGAGSCSRKLYYASIENIEPTNPIDMRTKRLLRLGNVVHEDIQDSLMRVHTRTLNRDNNISSNREKENKNKEKEIDDIVAKDNTSPEQPVYLYDLKTCGGWAWRMKFGKKKQLNPSIQYELQLGTYGYAIKQLFGRLDGMFLYYYNKDTSDMRAVEVPLTYLSRAYLYWKNINDEHKQGLPDFRVGVSPVQGWQCNYCQFKDHCNPR